MTFPRNIVTHLDELADVDLDTTPPGTGQALVYESGTWVPGTAAGFDPDAARDYFTMTDQSNGDVVEVTISSGAWVLTAVVPLTTESGLLLTTEGGDVLNAE